MEKGEIAQFEQFHLFPLCFPKAFFFNVLKWVYMEENVNVKPSEISGKLLSFVANEYPLSVKLRISTNYNMLWQEGP